MSLFVIVVRGWSPLRSFNVHFFASRVRPEKIDLGDTVRRKEVQRACVRELEGEVDELREELATAKRREEEKDRALRKAREDLERSSEENGRRSGG